MMTNLLKNYLDLTPNVERSLLNIENIIKIGVTLKNNYLVQMCKALLDSVRLENNDYSWFDHQMISFINNEMIEAVLAKKTKFKDRRY